MRYLALSLVIVSTVFGARCETPVESCEPCFYEYDNRFGFSPLNLSYERIKTDALYVGVEAWATYVLSNDRGHSNRLLGNAEVRIGHNYFYNKRDHVTPFLGAGIIKDFCKEWTETQFFFAGVFQFRERHYYQKSPVVYGVFGLLYDHEFNSIFNLGLNFKGMIGGGVGHNHRNWGSTVAGIEVGLPITFRFGSHRHWDFRLEPLYIFLNSSRFSRSYFGGLCTFGYRF